MKEDLCDRFGKASWQWHAGMMSCIAPKNFRFKYVICLIRESWFTATFSWAHLVLPSEDAARLLLEPRGYQMEREGAHSISGGFSAGRIGSIHSNGDRLELIAERYGSHHTICQVGW